MIIIPTRYENAEFDTLDSDIKEKYHLCHDNGKKNGLYIWGDVGTGKTHALYAIRKLIPFPEYKRIPDYDCDNILKMFQVLSDISEQTVHLNYISAHSSVLFLDDFGADNPKDWRISASVVMLRIIDYRYAHCLPTIISSNLSLNTLAEKYDSRIASRIKEMCHIINMKGSDKRI